MSAKTERVIEIGQCRHTGITGHTQKTSKS